ncbi:uncharacterized protein KRP23_13128 [Phytophthora ramorum]|uniref:uncharacterized protein n=1 Tax=Phytophthora ramorum TaxID=164328 RepID=UPI0030B6393D|nr:hypothetical protein KRP23_13128 [Phytophthora ramorum]
MHKSSTMDVITQSAAPPAAAATATKPGFFVQPATEANTSAGDAKFDQKVGEAAPPSNQESDGSADEARKQAFEKQFIASQATIVMTRPFRR